MEHGTDIHSVLWRVSHFLRENVSYMTCFWLRSGSRVPIALHLTLLYCSALPSLSGSWLRLCRTVSVTLHLQRGYVLSHPEADKTSWKELYYCFHDKLSDSSAMLLEVFRSRSPKITFTDNPHIGSFIFLCCLWLPDAACCQPGEETKSSGAQTSCTTVQRPVSSAASDLFV